MSDIYVLVYLRYTARHIHSETMDRQSIYTHIAYIYMPSSQERNHATAYGRSHAQYTSQDDRAIRHIYSQPSSTRRMNNISGQSQDTMYIYDTTKKEI
jgi:hypothetical protein